MTFLEVLQAAARYDEVSSYGGGAMVRSELGDWVNLDRFLDQLVEAELITQEQANAFWLLKA